MYIEMKLRVLILSLAFVSVIVVAGRSEESFNVQVGDAILLLKHMDSEIAKLPPAERAKINQDLQWCAFYFGALAATQNVKEKNATQILMLILAKNLRRLGAPRVASIGSLAAELKTKSPKAFEEFQKEYQLNP